jgi:hypothetical protein
VLRDPCDGDRQQAERRLELEALTDTDPNVGWPRFGDGTTYGVATPA